MICRYNPTTVECISFWQFTVLVNENPKCARG